MGSQKDSNGADDLAKSMRLMKLQPKPPRTPEEALYRQFEFWSTQPVPKMGKVLFTFCQSQFNCVVCVMGYL